MKWAPQVLDAHNVVPARMHASVVTSPPYADDPSVLRFFAHGDQGAWRWRGWGGRRITHGTSSSTTIKPCAKQAQDGGRRRRATATCAE